MEPDPQKNQIRRLRWKYTVNRFGKIDNKASHPVYVCEPIKNSVTVSLASCFLSRSTILVWYLVEPH